LTKRLSVGHKVERVPSDGVPPIPRKSRFNLKPRLKKLKGKLRRILIGVVLFLLLAPVAGVVFYRVVPPPLTPLMAMRWAAGDGLRKDWTGLDRIAPRLRAAVISAEDNLFCEHHGFDLGSLQDAVEDWAEGGGLRGASTLSMQTSKNLFLWPGRSFIRKGIEAYITVWLELLWPKERIMEVYLNIAEWGPGVFGAEAAARYYFGVPASRLTRRQAALMAAVLPNPREWNPARPTAYINGRARTLQVRMRQLGPRLDCVGGEP